MTEDERNSDVGRQRPVGGSAAWRRQEERPLRPAWDDRPEDARYEHASLQEQLLDGVQGLVRNRAAMATLILVFGGLAILAVLTPAVVRFDALAPLDCLYIRAGDPDRSQPVGPTTAVIDRLLSQGAERATCQLSHSHEVAGVIELPGIDWPGEAAVAAAAAGPCQAAFDERAMSPGGPDLSLTIVLPDRIHWTAGVRRAVCLAHRADGQFLTEPALVP